MDPLSTAVEAAVIGVVVVVVVFLLGRTVTLWYFKINEGLAALQDARRSLESINESMAEIAKALSPRTTPHQSEVAKALREAWTNGNT